MLNSPMSCIISHDHLERPKEPLKILTYFLPLHFSSQSLFYEVIIYHPALCQVLYEIVLQNVYNGERFPSLFI